MSVTEDKAAYKTYLGDVSALLAAGSNDYETMTDKCLAALALLMTFEDTIAQDGASLKNRENINDLLDRIEKRKQNRDRDTDKRRLISTKVSYG